MKKSTSILTLFVFFIFSFAMNAQKLSPVQQQKVNDLFKKSKVVYFKFPVNSMQEIAPMGKIVSIDSNKGNLVFAHANKDAFSKFILKNYSYTVVPHTAKPVAKAKPKVVKGKK